MLLWMIAKKDHFSHLKYSVLIVNQSCCIPPQSQGNCKQGPKCSLPSCWWHTTLFFWIIVFKLEFSCASGNPQIMSEWYRYQFAVIFGRTRWLSQLCYVVNYFLCLGKNCQLKMADLQPEFVENGPCTA